MQSYSLRQRAEARLADIDQDRALDQELVQSEEQKSVLNGVSERKENPSDTKKRLSREAKQSLATLNPRQQERSALMALLYEPSKLMDRPAELLKEAREIIYNFEHKFPWGRSDAVRSCLAEFEQLAYFDEHKKPADKDQSNDRKDEPKISSHPQYHAVLLIGCFGRLLKKLESEEKSEQADQLTDGINRWLAESETGVGFLPKEGEREYSKFLTNQKIEKLEMQRVEQAKLGRASRKFNKALVDYFPQPQRQEVLVAYRQHLEKIKGLPDMKASDNAKGFCALALDAAADVIMN